MSSSPSCFITLTRAVEEDDLVLPAGTVLFVEGVAPGGSHYRAVWLWGHGDIYRVLVPKRAAKRIEGLSGDPKVLACAAQRCGLP